jgi:hypothetical protein
VRGGGRPALRVETLDAHDRTISVTRRGDYFDYPGGLAATYDAVSRSVLVAWLRPASSEIRIDRIGTDGRADASSVPLLTEDNPMPRGEFALACNRLRRDCLLLYAVNPEGLSDLYIQRLAQGGRPSGYPGRIATDTGGGIGAAATRAGYAVAWDQGAITGPLTRRVIVAHLGAPGTHPQRTFDRKLPGPAQYTGALLVWLAQTGNPSWSRIYGEIVH